MSSSILGRMSFLSPEFCVEAVVLTVSTKNYGRIDGLSLSAAVSRRRDSVATTRWLARSVVSGGIGRQVADAGRPDARRGPSTQLVESY